MLPGLERHSLCLLMCAGLFRALNANKRGTPAGGSPMDGIGETPSLVLGIVLRGRLILGKAICFGVKNNGRE